MSLERQDPAMDRPPLPPFTEDTANQKVRLAEDAWNSRDPVRVVSAYTADSRWRNRSQFLQGHDAIVAFLADKWRYEHEYRLTKQLWTFGGNRLAVRFAYEWQDERGAWTRSYGNENWEFDPHGRMSVRIASINDVAIGDGERLFRWPLGRRPDGQPSLSSLEL
jgi:uncharacterized protein